jgi:hypothetical protein
MPHTAQVQLAAREESQDIKGNKKYVYIQYRHIIIHFLRIHRPYCMTSSITASTIVFVFQRRLWNLPLQSNALQRVSLKVSFILMGIVVIGRRISPG